MIGKRLKAAVKRHFMMQLAVLISWLVPRTRSICVVGGSRGKRFADNAKHFFVLAQQQKNTPQFIWLSPNLALNQNLRNKGFQAYSPNSLAGLYFGFRAGWHVFDVKITDTSEYSCIGANQLNLWHGIPLKKLHHLGGSLPQPGWLQLFKKLYRYCPGRQYMAHPAAEQYDYLSQVFSVPAENMIAANLPRNEILLHPTLLDSSASGSLINDVDKIIRKQLHDYPGKVIGYFPTWRETGDDKFLGATTAADIQALDKLLEEQGALLVTKWHSCSYAEYKHRGVSKTAVEIDQLLLKANNIRILPFDTDLNTVLDSCDMLISDYSGVLIDYLLLNRPLLLAAYDRDSYEIFTGLLPEYDDFNAGPKAVDFASALGYIRHYLAAPADFSNSYEKQRLQLRKRYFATEDSIQTLLKVISA